MVARATAEGVGLAVVAAVAISLPFLACLPALRAPGRGQESGHAGKGVGFMGRGLVPVLHDAILSNCREKCAERLLYARPCLELGAGAGGGGGGGTGTGTPCSFEFTF